MANLSGILVIGRCGMDDIPMIFLPTRKEAVSYAKKVTLQRIADMAATVFCMDVSIFCNVSIVPFIDGVPSQFELVKDFNDDEQDPGDPGPQHPASETAAKDRLRPDQV